jgi:hypothetical protein
LVAGAGRFSIGFGGAILVVRATSPAGIAALVLSVAAFVCQFHLLFRMPQTGRALSATAKSEQTVLSQCAGCGAGLIKLHVDKLDYVFI